MESEDFSAEQHIYNGKTTCFVGTEGNRFAITSWVSATENLIFIELNSLNKSANVTVSLTAPENKNAKLEIGESDNINWLTRAFIDNVDKETEVAIALQTYLYNGDIIKVLPGKKLLTALSIESNFKKVNPLEYVLKRISDLDYTSIERLDLEHNVWWKEYWDKSSVTVEDTILLKAYYQGLYTMAACSRDTKFPPGIFGWTTTDNPAWNGDYHLNYNFQAPFYSLHSSNRLEQAIPHDAPLLDFMPRGEWYSKNVSNTRGILYPVGIGPLGIEVTKDFKKYFNSGNVEEGGLFFGQRSNAAYGLINMAQYWRCTYDEDYGKKIYPYVSAVVNFWEDYLKIENDRYVIIGDAIHEGSGKNKNPILSLGLIRNALNLIIDLSSTLNVDKDKHEKWKDILSNLSDYPIQIRNDKKVFRYTEEGVDWWNDNGLGIQHIYPANAITLDSDKDLLSIAKNTINEMQRWHDNNTSNSFFMAAIRVGYNQDIILNELHKYALHTYPNGFQLNNPHGIENSCTVTNSLNEMLCMSVGNVIRLFSNYPKNQDASFVNLRTWGAFLVSAKLRNGVISDVQIYSEKGKLCTIVNPWKNKKVLVVRNGNNSETISGDRISFNTSINELIELIPE